MDLSQLSIIELTQLVLGHMQGQSQQPQPQPTASQPTNPSAYQATSAPLPVPMPLPALLLTTAGTRPIGPYQSLCLPSLPQVPQGHPSSTVLQTSNSSLSQPFLGRDSLALNMSAHINQQ